MEKKKATQAKQSHQKAQESSPTSLSLSALGIHIFSPKPEPGEWDFFMHRFMRRI